MIHFIFDWPTTKIDKTQQLFLFEFRDKRNYICDVDGSSRGKFKKLNWVYFTFKTVLKSKKDDLIVCWFDFHGVLCYLATKLFFRKRKILAINILLKNKKTLFNRLVSILYRWAFNDKYFYFTYTSKFMPYGTMKNSYLLPDTYVDRDELFQPYVDCGNMVFVGGHNSRDWDLAYQVAEAMPDVKFCFVMPHIQKTINRNKKNENIEEYYDLPYNEYLDKVAKCSIVFLPLKTDAPAGLIVLYEAAIKCKALIMTKTPVSLDYIEDHETGLLVNKGDCNNAVMAIRELVDDAKLRAKISYKLQKTVMEKGSFETYCSNLDAILKDILSF